MSSWLRMATAPLHQAGIAGLVYTVEVRSATGVVGKSPRNWLTTTLEAFRLRQTIAQVSTALGDAARRCPDRGTGRRSWSCSMRLTEGRLSNS